MSAMHTKTDILKRTKLLLTATLCVTYMSFGLAFSVLGSTLIDIELQIKSSMTDVSFAFVTRAVFACAFSLIFGWLFNNVSRQSSLAFGAALAALTMVLIPLNTNVFQFHLSQAAYGMSAAAMQVAINANLVAIWKKDSNPYLQGLHASYAVGTIFGPLISEPFLAPDTNRKGTSNGSLLTLAPLTPYFVNGSEESRIHIPFTICSGLLFAVALIQVISYFVSPVLDDQISDDKSDEEETTDDETGLISKTKSRRNILIVVLCGSVVLCFEAGLEINTQIYLQTFLVTVNSKISKSTAAFMQSTSNFAFTASRVLSIFLAMKLKTATMIYVDIALILLGTLIVFFTASSTSTAGLWIGVITLGLGFSSCWPCVYAFLEERIRVTSTISGILMSSTSLHSVAGPFIQGVYIERFPMIFAYVNLVSAIFVIVFFVLLHSRDFMGRGVGKSVN